jgi:hypothetical protein
MAYVVPRGSGWELRQSRATENGPRSRTLASFRELDASVVSRALERSEGELSADDVLRAVRRAGAPVAPDAATSAGASLLAELTAGRSPAGGIRRALVEALGAGDGGLSAAERAASAWIGRSEADRGAALHDLLLLVDALPSPLADARPRPPRLASGSG